MLPDSRGLASDSTEKSRAQTVTRITEKLETGAVPMDIRDFSWKEYREVFPQGTVETPIGKVRIGKNQFEKMDEKDNGKRRGLIGAMRQTLADPIAIIQEEKDGRRAYVFIKSFKSAEVPRKPDFIMSVVVTIRGRKSSYFNLQEEAAGSPEQN